jgi:hypothetical protein
MKPTWEQVKAFAESDLEEEKIPGPYAIALNFATALLTSGRFGDDVTAAVETAWTLVLPFYQGKQAYVTHVKTLAALAPGAAGPVEPAMSPAEARAYVTGGETGNTGEVSPLSPGVAFVRVREGVGHMVPVGHPLTATETIDLQAAQAQQVRIAEATKAVVAAQAVLEEAKALDMGKSTRASRARVAEAQAAFDAAAKVQSEAYL